MTRRLFTLWLTAAALAGCDDSGGSGPGDRPDVVTWHQDVAPIVHARCVGCHTDGGIAPFSLEAYSDAAPAAALMLAMVEQGKMPPGCRSFPAR